jgi:hypothetical protein
MIPQAQEEMQAVILPTNAKKRASGVYVFDLTVIRRQDTTISHLKESGCRARIVNISFD